MNEKNLNLKALIGDKIKNIMFVCTGNTCRSPMAEALMKKVLIEKNINNINVFSRGLSVYENLPASENSVKAIKKYNIDLSKHRAKLISQEEVDYSDLILTMSKAHKNCINSLFLESKDKVFTLYEFAFGKSKDISDPYCCDLSVYESCLDEIYSCINEII